MADCPNDVGNDGDDVSVDGDEVSVDKNVVGVDEQPRQQRHSQDFEATSSKMVVETSTPFERSNDEDKPPGVEPSSPTVIKKQQHNGHKDFNSSSSIHSKVLTNPVLFLLPLMFTALNSLI